VQTRTDDAREKKEAEAGVEGDTEAVLTDALVECYNNRALVLLCLDPSLDPTSVQVAETHGARGAGGGEGLTVEIGSGSVAVGVVGGGNGDGGGGGGGEGGEGRGTTSHDRGGGRHDGGGGGSVAKRAAMKMWEECLRLCPDHPAANYNYTLALWQEVFILCVRACVVPRCLLCLASLSVWPNSHELTMVLLGCMGVCVSVHVVNAAFHMVRASSTTPVLTGCYLGFI
jgi:hypothetical protein